MALSDWNSVIDGATVAEFIDHGFAVVDTDYSLVHVSTPFAEMLEHQAEEMRSRPLSEFLDSGEQVVREDPSFWTETSHRRLELTFRTGSGSRLRASVTEGAIVKDAKLVGSFLIVKPLRESESVTDMKAIEAALRNERDRALLYLETAGVMLIALDREGQVTLVNRKGYEVLGYKQEEMIGTDWFTLVPEDSRAAAHANFLRLMSGELEHIEYVERPVVTKSGEERLIAWYTNVLRSADGSIMGVVTSGDDITEIKKAQESLKASEARYRAIVEQSLVGLCILTPGEYVKFLFANSTVGELVGYSPQELVNLSFEEVANIIHDDDRSRMIQYMQSCFVGEIEGQPISIRLISRGGTEIWVELASTRVQFEGDVALLTVVLNITKRVVADQALRQERQAFHTIAQAAISAIDTTDLGQRIIRGLMDSLGFEMGALRLYDEKDDTLVASSRIGEYWAETPGSIRCDEENEKERINVYVARKREPVFAPNVEECEVCQRYGSRLDEIGVKGIIIWPIVSESGKLLAVMSLATKEAKDTLIETRGFFHTVSELLTTVIERLKAEEALRLSDRRYWELLTYIGKGVTVSNLDERITFVNKVFADMLGYEPEELVGMSIVDILPPAEIERVFEKIEERKLGRTESYIVSMLRKDGTERIVRVSAVPSWHEQGHVEGSIAFMTDITDQTRAENEVRRLNEELSELVEERTAELAAANKELEAFAYAVSHDLRAPLRSVDGFSQALLEDHKEHLDDTALNYLQRIRRAATRMGHLIDDILNLSKVARSELDRAEISLTAMAKDVVDELRTAEPDRVIEIDIADNLRARCDRRLIHIALQNLIGNSWKFTSHREESKIEFGSTEIDGETVFYIRDNGIGFDQAYAERLFKPFQRLHRADEFEGTGVGLATVHRIIDRHGGRIWAEGEESKGSTFYFTLQA